MGSRFDFPDKNGRSERIRTSDPCVPNAVLYQAEPHSDRGSGPERRRSEVRTRLINTGFGTRKHPFRP